MTVKQLTTTHDEFVAQSLARIGERLNLVAVSLEDYIWLCWSTLAPKATVYTTLHLRDKGDP